MKNIVKMVLINMCIFFSIIGFIVLSPIIIYKGYKSLKDLIIQEKTNDSFYKEYKKVKQKYHDFVTYKDEEFQGKIINIDKNGNRFTHVSKNFIDNDSKYIFFGGSIIWGYGESDEKTIPSIYSQKNRVYTENFAVSGYTSRQSLAKLINYYVKNPISTKKRIIIFTDGALDYYMNCRDDDMTLKTGYSEKIVNMLNTKNPLSFEILSSPSLAFFKKLKNRLENKEEISLRKVCSKEKIKFITTSILRVWSIANQLAKVHGDEFIAVLPPSILDREDNTEDYKKEYKELRKNIKNYTDINFIDLSKIFTDNKNAYLDSMHYSFEGKKIYVKELTKEIKKLEKNK